MEKKAALCKQVLTFNTVFYLTFLGLCCQVTLNLQSCHALEFSGTACLETTTEQNLVLCYWKDVCFLLVSAGDRSFCGPGANRVIAAWNLNDMVMNEPAGWGKQNHVLWNRMVFGSQGGSFHYIWSLFCSCSEIQEEPHLRHFMAWHCRMITGCRFACGTSTLI